MSLEFGEGSRGHRSVDSSWRRVIAIASVGAGIRIGTDAVGGLIGIHVLEVWIVSWVQVAVGRLLTLCRRRIVEVSFAYSHDEMDDLLFASKNEGVRLWCDLKRSLTVCGVCFVHSQ